MRNLFSYIDLRIKEIIKILIPELKNIDNVLVEIPNKPEYGEFSTNAALVVGKQIKKPPMEIANLFLKQLQNLDFIKEVKIADPGFLNFNLKESFWRQFLKSVFINLDQYGLDNIGQGSKIHLEFVSVNPTGPLHIGHTRGAIYGDAIANILVAMEYNVVKEYYINDAGNQINTLIESLKIRYKNLFGANLEIPEGYYPGEYLIDIAQRIRDHFDVDIELIDKRELIDFAVNAVMDLIKKDLADLGVKHDVFVSEYHDVMQQGKVQLALDILESKGLIYKGVLDRPKSIKDGTWESKEQMLFRSKSFGDDTDRVVIKSDGSYTYFVGDIAYHYYKLERGFKDLILLLGADHGGYIKRISAVVNALSNGTAKIDVRVNQLVNLFRNGKPFKMSKRSGNFITVRDIIDEIGKDAFRFAMLSKRNDTALDIDFVKLKEQSKDNPIWYVQYAHTRCQSVFRRARALGFNLNDTRDIDFIYSAKDMELIKVIASYPKILYAAAIYHEPHRVNYYLQELANSFHQLWSSGTDDNRLRFIDETDMKFTLSRLALVKIVAGIISSGLKLLGIEPINEM